MKPQFEQVTVPVGESWSLLWRELPELPFLWHYHPEFELTLTLNNNVTPNKAIGVLGGFDTSAGTFEVGGRLTAYFANVAAVQAVRNNEDVTLDMLVVKDNQGLLFDLGLIGLGDGRLNIEQDAPITLPLDTEAAENVHGNTLLFQYFPYLPNVAA